MQHENCIHATDAGFVTGLGFGLSQQNTILAVQTVADKEYIAIATALVSNINAFL